MVCCDSLGHSNLCAGWSFLKLSTNLTILNHVLYGILGPSVKPSSQLEEFDHMFFQICDTGSYALFAHVSTNFYCLIHPCSHVVQVFQLDSAMFFSFSVS